MGTRQYFRLAEALAAVGALGECLVRVETPERSHYEIHADPAALAGAVLAAGGRATYHEITRVSTDPYPPLQRLYFDFDLPRERWGERGGREAEAEALRELGAAVRGWALAAGLPPPQELAATSSDYVTKVSLHVTYPEICFREHTAMKRLALELRGALPGWVAGALDILYKRNQGLRLTWSRKPGAPPSRQKRPLAGPWPPGEGPALAAGTVHAYGGSAAAPADHLAPRPPEFAPIAAADPGNLHRLLAALEAAERAAAAETGGTPPPPGGAYRERGTRWTERGSVTSLLRTAPSCCCICRRTHDSENPMICGTNGHYRLSCPRAAAGGGPRSAPLYQDPHASAARAAELTAARALRAEIGAEERRLAAARAAAAETPTRPAHWDLGPERWEPEPEAPPAAHQPPPGAERWEPEPEGPPGPPAPRGGALLERWEPQSW